MDIPAGQPELRILILEDVPTDAELAESALREAGLSFTAKRVDTREAFIRALEEFKPDIVLADYKLPAFDGGSAVKIVREQYPTIPVVMLTGAVGDETAAELLKLGARDYVLKDRLARLGPAVRRALSEEQGIRARKAAEEALRHSEERFRSVFENVKDVILTLSADGTLMMLNPAFEQITGWTCAEWLGKSFSSLVHPDDLPNALHLLQRAMRGEALPVFELRILKKIGGYVVGEITISPLLHDGANAYLLGTARDITERKQAEEKIRESEAKFRAVVETTSDWIWETDEHGSYTYVSPVIYDLLGYTPEEMLGKTPFDLMPPEEAARVGAVFGSIAAERRALQSLENTCLHKDGHAVILETSGVPIFDGSGAFRGYRGIDRDITKRKQAEEKIQEQSRLLDLIFANSQDSIVLLDKDYNFIKVSESYAKSCQRDVSEFAGHNHFEFYPSPLKDEFDEALSKNLIYSRNDRPFSFSDHPEWGITYWDLVMVPIRGPENKIEFFLFTLRDVTKRKQAETRIQKLTLLYATLSQTNEIIVRATGRKELLCSICRAAVEHGKFAMAWWGEVDEAARTVTSSCHHGAEEGYLTDIVISIDDVPEGRGPTGTSIRENRISYVNDYATDERTLPWREAALKRGFRGAAGIPLRFNGRAIGALTIYVDETGFFDADQLHLLEEMATDIGFALDNFAREAERKAAQNKLVESEHHFRAVTESASDAIITAAGAGDITGWNAAASRLFGYAEAEIVGRPLTVLMPERFRSLHTGGMARVLAGGAPHLIGKTVELAGLRKDGSEFPLEISLAQWQAAEGLSFSAIIRDIAVRKQVESRLAGQLDELRRWQEATLGREMRTLELKREVNELLVKAGQPPRYPSVEQGNEE